MRAAPERANVELRETSSGEPSVVLAFPYDPELVARVRRIPQRRFDWDAREWSAPADDWTGVHVADLLERHPELSISAEAGAWLAGIQRRWVGRVSTRRRDGRGWWVLVTAAGQVPETLRVEAVPDGPDLLVPLSRAGAVELRRQRSARLDAGAERCAASLELGDDPPPARLVVTEGVDGRRLRLEVLWDPEVGSAFEHLPGAESGRTLPIDPWVLEPLDAFLARHGVQVAPWAAEVMGELRADHEQAREAIALSRATSADPIEATASVLNGRLEPFQWAAVRYALRVRRTFLADEQGLGKTVEALAALESDGAYPAIVVCPASLKLNWRKEIERWLPHRSVSVLMGRTDAGRPCELTVLNYELVAAHRERLAARHPRALVVDESHYVKNPQAQRTRAVRRLAGAISPDGLRLALTGTPVLNHADELIAQLRVLGRLEDFGSGARFSRQFQGELSEERLHWHLRRRCFVRRSKAEVLPQLPAKRRVVIPMELSNRREYRLAEEDVIAWLREQPLDLSELEAKIAATLRAERLAQLGTLQRLAARGKLAAALAWIADFQASGEPLVVFARHREIQEAVLERFPDSLHLLGRDPIAARERTVAAFQSGEGSGLLVCATRVAAQGLTLTRASNVAFLELEWTPAMHEQAEDRCHRMGQQDAVCAWYLLAAETIDERMARLIEHKRGLVAAVTDGRSREDEGVVEQVIRELREGQPARHLSLVE
ncbi:MAG TPA: DEAD/DEAH box helicase [Solirubrobacteraceae bacterium]|jgi:superfamily II DNA or RNA helicase|nr:DEAD/DEAH box helicase [Solirubrobacteraceae bacterium]